MNRLIRKIHLWIGLPLGGLFFVISLSGALYIWEPEIATIIYKEKVEPQEKPFVSISTLEKEVTLALPGGDFRTVYFRGPSRAVQVLLYAPGTYYHANLNPYTGKLIHLQDMNKGWLNHLKFLHRNLILGNVGRQIVHWGTLLYLAMVLSGIVIWWPSKKVSVKQLFNIKGLVLPGILNYDIHRVFGFYASWILIFVILTGLFWGFDAVKNSLRNLSGEDEIKYDIPLSYESNIINDMNKFQLLEQFATRFRKEFPGKNIRIHNLHKNNDPVHVVIIDKNHLVHNVDHLYFDRYSGRRLIGNFEYGPHQESSLFTKLKGLAYDIHFGSILGLTGRILVFFASLMGASLPVTGFLIWWNKKGS